MAHSPRKHEDYRIGIICALAIEKAPLIAMLDEIHPKLKKKHGDENEYILGRMAVHDVVIACLPAGLMGNGPAAMVASHMHRSFPIEFGLIVGIGGGVWSKQCDIRLGDVVVSQPTGTHGGVVQWDFGKTGKGGQFQRTGSLDKPPPVLLQALQGLKTFDLTDGIDLKRSLSLMIGKKPQMGKTYRYQGAEDDQLFEATYDHEGDETCKECDNRLLVQRPPREGSIPKIHYGNIASGNEVMKHGTTRDKIAREEGVICFEMEAAGLMDTFRCLVIKGICDYADSHKNNRWQAYAAAMAAAYAKELLSFVSERPVISQADKSPAEGVARQKRRLAHPTEKSTSQPKRMRLQSMNQLGTARPFSQDCDLVEREWFFEGCNNIRDDHEEESDEEDSDEEDSDEEDSDEESSDESTRDENTGSQYRIGSCYKCKDVNAYPKYKCL